jgi:hypothetical protein
MDELYRDLVKDEIKLRLAVDGDDRVGAGRPFGALVSLRFTNSVDRETGGFSKYLMNGVFARVGNQFRQVNHRDELQKSIERALADRFDIEAIGFFDPYMPPRGVVEGGEGGWMEKPLAYLVLSRKDPAVAALPAVGVDMQFTDQAGPVTLEIVSNSVPLAVGDAATSRPCECLEVEQLVDVRGASEGAKDGVTLEVRMRGKGVVPNLRDALAGLDAPLAGFELGLDGIVADPPVVVTAGDPASMRTMMMTGQPSAPKDGYPEPDADGMYRLPIERTWRVTRSVNQQILAFMDTRPEAPKYFDAPQSTIYFPADCRPSRSHGSYIMPAAQAIDIINTVDWMKRLHPRYPVTFSIDQDAPNPNPYELQIDCSGAADVGNW